jgi:hypothetical protein
MVRQRTLSGIGVVALLIVGTSCGDSTTEPVAEMGALTVMLTMTGNLPDADGCMVSVDGGSEQAITSGDSLRFLSLVPGSHVVWLSDVAAHCSIADDNPRVVSVTGGDTTTTSFEVTCNATIDAHIVVDKIAVSVVPGGSEVIKVRAIDQTGVGESWTATSNDPAMATLTKLDSIVVVTGVDFGTTTITLVSESGVSRDIPVRVYDHMVLDAGELTLAFVSAFDCRWHDGGSGGDYDGSFYHPKLPEGFKALGSLGLRAWGCPNIDGRQWMLVVKANDGSDALAPPESYTREYDDAGSGADLNGSFWTPNCPAGYVAMGSVAQHGWGSPGLDDVTCVREDLTRAGEAVSTFIWIDAETGANDYVGIWRTTISDMAFHEDAWLETGTFVATGSERSCSGSACWQAPYSHPAMNVLAVDLPLLIDTPTETRTPQLVGFDQPPVTTAPLMTKTMLVPFTALLGGVDFSEGDIVWLLEHSPFVRVERQVYNRLMFHTINYTSLVQENALELVSGISTTDSETFSHTVGISITVESGVEFLGSGGKVSTTMSYEFGYESMHSVTSLQEQHITVTIYTQPGKAAACWQQRNMYVVKRHNGTDLDVLAEMEFGMDSYVVDEYPNQ